MVKHLRKRSGSLILVVVLLALTGSILAGIVLKAGSDIISSTERTDSVVLLYNIETVADILINQFVSDLDAAWRSTPFSIDHMQFEVSDYEEMIQQISDAYLIFDSSRNEYVYGAKLETGEIKYPNAGDVVSTITFDPTLVPSVMGSKLNMLGREIGEYSLISSTGLVPAINNENNILSFGTGDVYYLEDLQVSLTLAEGVITLHQNYIITGLKAEFSVLDSGVECRLSADDVQLQLVSQTLTR